MHTTARALVLAAALTVLASLQGCVVFTLGSDGELQPVAPSTVVANPGLLLGTSKSADDAR